MPAIRTGQADQSALAVEDLTMIANRSAGVSISVLTPPNRVTVEGVGSKPWHAKIHHRSSLSPREARMLVAGAPRGAHVVVADQISADAKEYLASVPSWGWLDRRSELRLRHGSAELEIRLSPASEDSQPGGVTLAAPASDGPIRGRAGISYAAALLLQNPTGPPSIRLRASRGHGPIDGQRRGWPLAGCGADLALQRAGTPRPVLGPGGRVAAAARHPGRQGP